MALDYLFLNILSYNTIENYLLDRYAFPVRSYYPLYSELFSIESILLYMIIAGAALAMKANQNSDSQQASHFTGHLAIFFAVLAVPARLMTRGLIDCDTLYFAFVMFFSSLLLYGSVRNGLNIQPRMSFKEFAKVFAVLALLFWFLEPWHSPSRQLTNAIKEGDVSRFTALSQKYPRHLRMNPGLLDAAFSRPVPEIIRTIVESGNTSISSGYMNLEIFNPAHIQILAYLHANGVNFASMDMLRNAVAYTTVPARPRRNRISGVVDKNYPVLRLLLQLYHAAPEGSRKRSSENSGECGWENLLSIAAVEGDADLMAFLIDQGFAIDEEVYQALALNKHIDKPAIKALLQKSRFVVDNQNEHKTMATIEPSSNQTLQTVAETETTQPAPVKQPANLTASPSDVSISTARVDTPDSLQLRPEPDGLEMILGSGADVKRYRENQQNIFHFLAENWRAPSDSNRTYNVDFASVFARAMKRKLTLDKKDKRGLTPLWAALQANNLRPFIRFLEAGADRSAYNTEGLTLIEFCNKNNRKILLGLLTDLRPYEK